MAPPNKRPSSLPISGGSLRSRPERVARPVRQPEGQEDRQPDLFDYDPPIPRTSLSPEEAPLLVVTTRAFTDRDREDGWLYCLVGRHEGETLMQNGLTLDARHPLSFCTRPAVIALLSSQDEENAHVERVLLRVRHPHIAPWLETDPDMSAQLGASCYLLSRQVASG